MSTALSRVPDLSLTRRTLLGGLTAGAMVAGGASLGLGTARADNTSEPQDPRVQEVLDQDPNVRWLGQPVTSRIGSPAVVGQEDGRWVSYQVFKGRPNTENPGALTITDIETGEVIRVLRMNTVESATCVVRATDGKIYLGTYSDRHLWVYDPVTHQLRDIGAFNPADIPAGQVFGMTPGPNGTVYIGAYPHANVYHYDPATDVITNLGSASTTEKYVHGMAYDPDNDDLYVGVGGIKASIWRWSDGGRGELTRVTNESTMPGLEAEVFVSKITWLHGRLFVRTKNNALAVLQTDGTVDYWKAERAVFGFRFFEVPGDPNLVMYGFGGNLFHYDIAARTTRQIGGSISAYIGDLAWVDVPGDDPDWPGLTIYGADAAGVIRLNLESGASESHEVDFAQPTKIQKIFRGPDNRMWASGYMIGLAEINTAGGPALPTVNSGQYESGMVRGDQMYLGSYGNARFNSFDPATPTTKPRVLFDGLAQKQDRPFALAYNPDRDEAYLGSVPMYGQHQGGLAVYEFAGGSHEWFTSEVVDGQSVISVVYNPGDGLVYVGTTLDGGLGSTENPQTEAKLVVWDPATRTTVSEIVPVPGAEGITGLVVGPDQKVWGIAENVLFTLAPDTREVDHTQRLPFGGYGDNKTYWVWAFLNVSPIDNNVYGTVSYRTFRIDGRTKEFTMLVDGVGHWGMTDDRGDLYFAGLSTHMFKYVVPQPITGVNSDQKCLAVRAAQEGRALDLSGLKPEHRDIFERIVQRVENGEGSALEQEYCSR